MFVIASNRKCREAEARRRRLHQMREGGRFGRWERISPVVSGDRGCDGGRDAARRHFFPLVGWIRRSALAFARSQPKQDSANLQSSRLHALPFVVTIALIQTAAPILSVLPPSFPGNHVSAPGTDDAGAVLHRLLQQMLPPLSVQYRRRVVEHLLHQLHGAERHLPLGQPGRWHRRRAGGGHRPTVGRPSPMIDIVAHGSTMMTGRSSPSATIVAIPVTIGAPPPRHAVRDRVPELRSYPIHGVSRRGARAGGQVQRAHERGERVGGIRDVGRLGELEEVGDLVASLGGGGGGTLLLLLLLLIILPPRGGGEGGIIYITFVQSTATTGCGGGWRWRGASSSFRMRRILHFSLSMLRPPPPTERRDRED